MKLFKPYNVNLSKLSPPSKQFILFRNANGFRPLLLQSSLFDCYPFKEFNKKKEIVLANKKAEIAELCAQLNYEYAIERIEYNKHQLDVLRKEFAETPVTNETIEKRYALDGEIKAVEQFLKKVKEIERKGKDSKTEKFAYEELNIHGFNEKDPRYEKKIEEYRRLERNFYTETAGGKCDACGIVLPNSIEKHIDFLSLTEVNLCPFCHSCEHLDDSNVMGTVSYIPYFSQEQINLFYYTYFILKYALEGDKESIASSRKVSAEYTNKIREKQREIKRLKSEQARAKEEQELAKVDQELINAKGAELEVQIVKLNSEISILWNEHKADPRLKSMLQREAMLNKKINSQAINFTYGELFKYMTNLDRYFHSGENILIRYFENVANFNPAALKREYEDRIQKDIENLDDFIQQENGIFNAETTAYPVRKLFTYNIDSPNSPHFIASFFMREGAHIQTRLTKEESLNLFTRISGVRYLPNFEKFKVHIKGWIGHYLTDEMDNILNNFISLNMTLFDESTRNKVTEVAQRSNAKPNTEKSPVANDTEKQSVVDNAAPIKTQATETESTNSQSAEPSAQQSMDDIVQMKAVEMEVEDVAEEFFYEDENIDTYEDEEVIDDGLEENKFANEDDY